MLYGRTAESGRLDALFDQTAAGRGGALVVRGEPGVGKTTLLTDAVSRADVRVLWTQGFESEFPLAFAALHRLLRPILGSVERLPRRQADALLVALGEQDGPTGDRFGVYLAALSLLTEVADPRPVVVVADDAQWLDEGSAEALLFVARRVQTDRVAVVFAAREGDVRRFDGRGLDELTIGGLDATAAGALLAERAGRPVSDEVRDILLAHTDGNPLALAELPTLLSPPQLTGRAGLPERLPMTAGVERAFLDRCLRLTPPAQKLLVLASADDSGLVAIIQPAAVLLGLDEQALAEAERSGLVQVRGAELHFRHPLVRSAVYGAATVPERQQVHRALAVALESAGENDRRAWHLAMATEGPDEEIAVELEAVADRAEHRGGHAAASAAWERSAALSPVREDKGRRLFAAATSAWVAGQPGRARALVDEARQRIVDPLRRADLETLRARLEWNVGSAATGYRIIMTAARDAAAVDAERALEMAMLGTALATYGGATALDEDAISLVPPLPESSSARLLCLSALVTGQHHLLGGRMAEAAVALRRAFDLVRLTGEDLNLLANTALGAFHLGDWSVTSRDLSRVLEAARAAGDVSRVLFALSRTPMADIPRGRWDVASAAVDEALVLAQVMGQPALTALPLAWRALLAALRGSEGGLEALEDLAAVVAGGAVGIGAVAVKDIAGWARGVAAAASSDFSAAFHHLHHLELPAMGRAAAIDRLEAAAHAGHPAVVVNWAADLERFAADTGAAWAAAAAAHGRAMISNGPAAEAEFRRALDSHETDPRPFDRARTRLAYGELLRRSGRRVDSRALLRTALETFDGLGAAAWADRAQRALRASGESARRRDPSTVLILTTQEQQVAHLVQTGLSNRDVAARLFVSPRTVEYHLSNAYQKLGVRSRGELVGLPLS